MQLSIRHQFGFLCIPKCASTSIERAIRPFCEVKFTGHPSLKHINARKFERYIRPLLHKADPRGTLETFCIMREPMDRIRSWYTYQRSSRLSNKKHPKHERYTGELSYIDFIEGYLATPQPKFAQIGTQAKFIRLADGALGVNRIFRLDQMDAVAEYLSQKVGKTVTIPRANRSEKTSTSGSSGLMDGILAKVAPESQSDASSEELPQSLVVRLKEHLADDYAIYESIAS